MRRRLIRLTIMTGLLAVPAGWAAPAQAGSAGGPPSVEPAGTDPHLVALNHVAGQILDISPGRILYRTGTTELRLRIKDRRTGRDQTVPGTYASIPYARLGPNGAAFVAWPGGDTEDRVTVWTGSRLLDLGSVHTAASVRLRRGHLLWVRNHVLRVYDMATRVTHPITTDAAETGNEVLPNGDVLFTRFDRSVGRNRIFRKHFGIETVLPVATRVVQDPVADANTVVYQGTDGPVAAGFGLWQLGRTALTHLAPTAPAGTRQPGTGYETSGGWTAFLAADPANGRLRVWLRAPDGLLRSVSTAPAASANLHLVALSPNGQVLYAINNRLYLGRLGSQPRLLADGLGGWDSQRTGGQRNTARYLAGHWYLGARGTLYVLANQVLRPVGPDGPR